LLGAQIASLGELLPAAERLREALGALAGVRPALAAEAAAK
jgi:hypothetical protein